ncbi:Alpha-N-acetylgalactosamine-specific lectin [Holothuria leucospilota]|uniref:Alpha-N-acetylgalactosamine-specific lectin n=1 Tax=Holothuria leucospilota TaxID=206669 RepID=A0A9Q1C923_HOLLE|nr:Alpha-N-acetylgalactosamine-specific lectin [Holothuria leucospilota]
MKYFPVLIFTIIATLFSVAQGNCLPEWTEWNGHCYRYMSQYRKNWAEASNICKTESQKNRGHLVTIESEKENEFLRNWWINILSPLKGGKWQYIWTGLNDIDEEGTFVWSDGSHVTYTNWGESQPDNRFNNSDCVTMVVRRASDPGKWDDARCYGRRAYICEYTCTDCENSNV